MNIELPFCKCGCGNRVTKQNNKYIWGHNGTGRIVSEEERKKMRNRMKGKTYEELYGKERAIEVKKKLWQNRETFEPPNKGKTWDELYGKEKSNEMKNKIAEKHRINPIFKNRTGKNNPYYKGAKDSLFKHWDSKITEDEKQENNEGKIEVKCRYCNRWFVPTQVEMDNRIGELRRGGLGCNFYCSKDCKELCPDHYQVLWPKNFKPYDNKYNQTEVSSSLRKMVFERDNWICQKCESTEKLECHHIDPVSQEPMFANDMDSCITLCKECHKYMHMKIDGCKYHELKKQC